MSVNTILLDFSIEPERINDESSRKDLVKIFKLEVEKYFEKIQCVYDLTVSDGQMYIFNDQKDVILTLRFFDKGLITLNIEYYKREKDEPKISFEVSPKFL
jgi:spermine synthase